ncbi:maltokinase N-terminal cap-like domain-containing protein [Sanguibacter suaedae]|uniref:Maltokinase n=1 Tax=Sanguibacter suaedae TaxID=2795737 RepID=A0A934IDX4_9MICO|nr:phosphotransferase [Sanguibacter suaedae]MBI9116076.1 phosphotransferase [Sanguibacter suaedae]
MAQGHEISANGGAHRGAVLDALRGWLPERRWFPAKGVDVELTGLTRVDLATETVHGRRCDVIVEVVHVRGSDSDVDVVLHVPLVVEHRDPVDVPPGTEGVVALLDGAALYDGAQHQAFWGAWLDTATWADGTDVPTRPYDFTDAQVLKVEQSNTSVILPRVCGGSMLKVLRSLAPGQNPDIVVPLALTQVGWRGVPAPYAWHEVEVVDTQDPETRSTWTAHSGVLAELVPQASDGFRLACDRAGGDESFNSPARELGTQVAQMHSALRRAFPDQVEPADATWLLSAMQRRVRSAAASSSAVRERLDDIEDFLQRMRTIADEALAQGRPLPPVQRIHGDLHLGQALYSPQKGWRILDFEGEPLRPLKERTRPDLGERDVAGMLRSFDYAAAIGGSGSTEWARGARRAFLDGYTGYLSVPGALGFGQPPSLADRVVILDAFELDKALYEVVYEERNRPDWLRIPLAAVDRILGRDDTPTAH